MKKLTLLLVALIMSITQPMTSVGQEASTGAIDMDRMNRDIRIMEGVLNQMFELEFEYNGLTFPMFYSSDEVQGTYLPGFGVIFTVPNLRQGRQLSNLISRESGASFNPNTFVDTEVTEGIFEELVTEFLVDYVSAIGQLNPESHFLIIHDKAIDEQSLALSRSLAMYQKGITRTTRGRESGELPVISMSVTKQNLDEFRSGDINRSEFEERIETVIETQTNSESHSDLDLLANILQTALKSNEDSGIAMNRTPIWYYLDNFGALFHVELSFSPEFLPFVISQNPISVIQDDSDTTIRFNSSADSTLQVIGNETEGNSNLDRARQEILQGEISLDSTRVQILRGQQRGANSLRENIEYERARVDSVRQLREIEIQAQLDECVELIKELIVDYGQTLTSIENNQSLLLILNVNATKNETIHIRAIKSDIEAVGRETITREQAMERISVTRQQ